MTDRLRVLRTIRIFYPHVTGPANQAYWISRCLAEQGVDSSLITTRRDDHPAPDEEQMDGFHVRRIRESWGVMAYRRIPDASAIVSASPDLFHIHCYRDRLCTLATQSARRRSIPFVVQPHGALAMYRHILTRWRRWPYHGFDHFRLAREVLSADRVVVATDQEAQEAIECGVHPERVVVIPVGAQVIAPEDRQPAGATGQIRALFVGRISPNRNVEQILQAIGLLKHRLEPDQFRLDIVGPAEARSAAQDAHSYYRSLQELTRHLGIQSYVSFRGPLFGDELRNAYLNADLFLYLSRYENFGQTVLEAAACGCPLIASPTGVATDLIRDGATGYLVATDDVKMLAARLEGILDDPSRLTEFSSRLLHDVATRYRWSAIAQQYHDLYRSLRG